MIIIAVFTAVFFTSCGKEKAEKATCHTELVSAPLETAVVADADIVRTGQSINGIVKDHSKKVVGYTKDMFLADNPQISGRNAVTKLDPCDSTKVKYRTIPVHAGDIIFLRHPLRIDTISGYAKSIVWKEGEGRIKHVIDMDNEQRFIISDQDIVCQPEPVKEEGPVLPPNGDGGNSDRRESPDSGDRSDSTDGLSQWWGFGFPWWFWIFAGLLIIALAIWRGSRGIHRRQDTGNNHSERRNTLLQQVINNGGLRGGN